MQMLKEHVPGYSWTPTSTISIPNLNVKFYIHILFKEEQRKGVRYFIVSVCVHVYV